MDQLSNYIDRFCMILNAKNLWRLLDLYPRLYVVSATKASEANEVTKWLFVIHLIKCSLLLKKSAVFPFQVLEPQPWKCYRTASRRMRKLNQPDFEKIEELRFQGAEVLKFIDRTCVENGFERVSELGETHWSRPIWVYSSK